MALTALAIADENHALTVYRQAVSDYNNLQSLSPANLRQYAPYQFAATQIRFAKTGQNVSVFTMFSKKLKSLSVWLAQQFNAGVGNSKLPIWFSGEWASDHRHATSQGHAQAKGFGYTPQIERDEDRGFIAMNFFSPQGRFRNGKGVLIHGDANSQYKGYHVDYLLDLDREWKLKSNKIEVISYQGDPSQSFGNDYPVIESWIAQNNISFTVNNYFRETQYKKIIKEKNKNKNINELNEKVYVLPYYTSHFGHFVGDILGSILYYLLKFNKEKRKLLIICPSDNWKNFFLDNFKEQIYLISPKEILENRYFFNDAVVLPRMSTFQNLQLSRNYFLSQNLNKNFCKKIFLTTERSDRISNIDELIKKLSDLDFKIINPTDYNIIDLCNYIKNSEILICEKASIMNNLLLARDKKFYLLSSEEEKNLNHKFFIGAGIYKTFIFNLINEIYCPKDPENQNDKPYKNRIKVDINKLKNILEEKK